MRLVYTLLLLLFLASCTKEESLQSTTSGSGTPTTPTDSLKGKIKKMIASATGNKQASIEQFEYDANHRLQKYTIWNEDSSFIPVKVSNLDMTIFYYNGSDDKPISDSVVSSLNTRFSKTYFTYNAANKLAKTERYDYTGKLTRWVNYIYVPNIVIRNCFDETSPGTGIIQLQTVDSAFLDAQNRLAEIHSYSNWSNPALLFFESKTNITYDAYHNPLDDINTNKYLKFDYEADYFYANMQASNNCTTYKLQEGIMSASNQVINYTYNSLGYPVSATSLYTAHITDPAVTESAIFTYLYY